MELGPDAFFTQQELNHLHLRIAIPQQWPGNHLFCKCNHEGENMAMTLVETSGTIRADGTLELDQKVNVPPGKVKVRLESVEAPNRAQESRFRELVRQWKQATLLMSSITDMATHPAYQQMIGMGQTALPLILEELRREPDQWFWALKAITGEDPVPQADRGNLPRMAHAWLAWAKDHGY